MASEVELSRAGQSIREDRREPIQIVFRNLRYTVRVKSTDKTRNKFKFWQSDPSTEKVVLNDVSGVMQPGRLCAVLGASGAGKTTLLNLLAGQARGGKISGEILVNGQPSTQSLMRKVSGYVFQDDVIMETQTVREALIMSALLTLPRSMSREEKIERVEEIITILHLRKCADTIIGSSMNKGVSGGERKRTAVGMTLVTDPGLLFLDEPTSGLDTFTAYSIVSTMKALARAGRTVVATLHQPSSEIFHMFDDLLLMAEGRIMYFGRAADSIKYFAARNYPCPQYTNPSDYFFMNILNPRADKARGKPMAIEAGDEESGEGAMSPAVARIQGLLDEWVESPDGAKMMKDASSPVTGGVEVAAMEKKATVMDQFSVLTARAMKNQLRNKLVVRAKLGQTLFMAVLVGLIYLQVSDNQAGIQNRLGALFFVAVNNLMSSAMGVLSVFQNEKTVFSREFSAGMYGVLAFFISKILMELPFQLLFPFIFATISYWMIGFQPIAGHFFIYACVVILVTNCGSALGMCISASIDNLNIALILAPMLILPLMIFSGFFVNNGAIPVYFDWIKYISPMKYGYEALVKNEFAGLTFTCSPSEQPCVTTGNQVIQQLGFADDGLSIGVCIAVLIAFWVGLLLLALLGLVRVIRSKYQR